MFPKAKILALVLLAFVGFGDRSPAAGADRGILRVEFLFSVESAGGRSERLRAPLDIFFDRKSNELYVADPGSRRILVYDGNGTLLQSIRIDGKEGSPTLVATDGDGRIYVGHNNSPRVSIFDYRGEPLEVLDLPGTSDAPGGRVRPMALANGPDGRVYALRSAGGVVGIDPRGESHREISVAGDGAPSMIYGMAVDPAGRFLFGDMRPYSVVAFDPKEKAFRRFGSAGILYGQLARPVGVAADGAGHIFVTSLVRNKVLCYDREGNFLEEFGGIGREYGQFYMPTKIVSDGKDRIFVLEEPLKRVQVFRVTFLKEKEVVDGSKGTDSREETNRANRFSTPNDPLKTANLE